MIDKLKTPDLLKLENHPVLFFDGVCTVCNGFIDFILKRDPSLFLFASLQGETARKRLDPNLVGHDLRSIVLYTERGIYLKARAVILVLSQLGWPWKGLGFLYYLPSCFLDPFYDFFASHRYRWFGRKETCRIPSPEERQRFLS